MAALAGLLNHQTTAGQMLSGNAASPTATSPTSGTSGTSSSSDSSDSSATISANDFLTLLVTEMQNQDPTADTDPNEYINQLVNVNSLEQLIDINQTLSTSLTTPSSSSDSGTSPQATTDASSAGNSAAPAAALSPHPASLAAAASTASTSQATSLSGNLSASPANPAAVRVGHALTQRMRAAAPGGIPLQ
ncbi:MAG: flagellar hook capping FlgD N-terminal domain-containing protein [Terracidiphilus sp.]